MDEGICGVDGNHERTGDGFEEVSEEDRYSALPHNCHYDFLLVAAHHHVTDGEGLESVVLAELLSMAQKVVQKGLDLE